MEGWLELRSPYFSLASGADRELSLNLARDLEIFVSVVAHTSSIEKIRPRLPARIYLFPDQVAYGFFRVGPDVIGHMISNPRGFFMLLSPVAQGTRELLFHEYGHFLMRNDSSLNYPLWYDEGIAMMFGTVSVGEDEITLGSMPTGAQRALRGWRPLAMERLLGARAYSELGRDMGRFYLQSWLTVHYFHAGHGRGHPRRLSQMREYLARLDGGEPWREAFASSFPVALEGLDDEIRGYWDELAEALTIPGVRVDRRRVERPSEIEVRELAPAQVAYELGLLYMDMGRGRSRYAERSFERALEHEPEHAGSLAGLAWARASRAEFEDAEIALQRALALGPSDPAVRRAEGDVRAEQSRARREEDPTAARERLEEARGAYRRAIELDPSLPAGYVRLARTYLDEPGDVAPAIEAMGRAYAALPWDATVNLQLGLLYLKAGRGDEARPHLERVLRWSHGERLEEAEALLAQLDEAAARAD